MKYKKIKLWWKKLITKHIFIELTDSEKQWIKLTKLHYSEKYRGKSMLEAAQEIYYEQYLLSETDLKSGRWKYNLLRVLISLNKKIDDGEHYNWLENLVFVALNGRSESFILEEMPERIDECLIKIIRIIQNNRAIDSLERKRYDLTIN